jgi:(2Fe-2S) ferredoxin
MLRVANIPARRLTRHHVKSAVSAMTYYKRHVFFCCNQRDPPEACCNNHGSADMQAYAKQRVKALHLDGKGKVRINKAGCLDRCNEGPVLVVYPEAVWYTYVDRHDIDEIIDSHIVHGRVVERLKI